VGYLVIFARLLDSVLLGIRVIIVTFSPQVKLIREVLAGAFPTVPEVIATWYSWGLVLDVHLEPRS
jgi:hypothetical protein